MWFVAGLQTNDTFEACSLDLPMKTLGIDRGFQVGNLFPFWIFGFNAKAGEPKAWECLQLRSPFTPVSVSFGVKHEEFGVLLRMSTAQWTAHGQNWRVTTFGLLVMAVKSMALANEMIVLIFLFATPF